MQAPPAGGDWVEPEVAHNDRLALQKPPRNRGRWPCGNTVEEGGLPAGTPLATGSGPAAGLLLASAGAFLPSNLPDHQRDWITLFRPSVLPSFPRPPFYTASWILPHATLFPTA
ncbi:unnamed protein product [Penicillium pancosmium]